MNTKERLEQEAALLESIDQQRQRSGDPNFGSQAEREILDRELKALENEVLADPGALSAMLVPLRRRKRGRM